MTYVSKTSVSIVGAGIGGLASALALARLGFTVRVFEQATELGEVGAGIQISPNGLAVLKALNVDRDLERCSLRANAVELCDFKQGSLVARLDLTTYASDLTYLFAHRQDVIRVLFEGCKAAGVVFTFGEILKNTTDTTLEFVSGLCVTSDFIVGADGLKSVVRQALNGDVKPFFTGQVAYRAIVPNVINQGQLARIHMGAKAHIVSYPLHKGRDLNLVMVREQSKWVKEAWRNLVDPQDVQSHFSNFGGEIAQAISHLDHVNEWGLFRHPVAKVWGDGDKALVGDAAHPTLPFMAQGANLALEDAWVLAQCLAQCLSPNSDFRGAVALYQAKRQDRVTRIVTAASKNAWKYHLSSWPLRTLAHFGMRGMSTIAPQKLVSQFDWIYRLDVTKG